MFFNWAGEDSWESIPWTTRRSNQSIIKEIIPEYPLEGLMLRLKLQYFGHLMWRANSFEKTLILEKIEGKWKRGKQRMRLSDDIINSIKLYDMLKDVEAWNASVHGVRKSWIQLSNWTTTIYVSLQCLFSAWTWRGECSCLLGLTCSILLGWGRGIEVTAGVNGECLPQLESAGSCHSLRWEVHFHRVVGPGFWYPFQNQDTQTLRKMW